MIPRHDVNLWHGVQDVARNITDWRLDSAAGELLEWITSGDACYWECGRSVLSLEQRDLGRPSGQCLAFPAP